MEKKPCYMVLVEASGHKSVYGNVLFWKEKDAKKAAEEAREKGLWDFVCVTCWDVV